jgi:LysR family transcriptional regulator, glycine cleavage system transcriptional activator
MSAPLPHLNWLRTFEASARHASFAAAAKELNLTPTAVSQQIKALENQLGYTLFERLARGIRLTNLGQAYLPSVRKAMDDLSMATVGLFGSGAKREVTLRAPVSFTALCLAPRLHEFRRAHEDIQVRIFSSVWSEALQDDKVDLDISYGNGPWDNYAVERLTAPVSLPVCPPGSDLGGDPATALRRLTASGPIHILGCENLWMQMARELAWPEHSFGDDIYVDTSISALEMVAAGLGCAMVCRDLAAQHLRSGRVVVPEGLALHHDQAHYILLPKRTRPPSAEALLFKDWLLSGFGS